MSEAKLSFIPPILMHGGLVALDLGKDSLSNQEVFLMIIASTGGLHGTPLKDHHFKKNAITTLSLSKNIKQQQMDKVHLREKGNPGR